MVSVSNFRMSLHRHNIIDARNVFANKSIGKIIRLGFVKLNAMFKQRMNLMIWTWIWTPSNSFGQLILCKNTWLITLCIMFYLCWCFTSQSTYFQLNWDLFKPSWVVPVLSRDWSVLLKNKTQCLQWVSN